MMSDTPIFHSESYSHSGTSPLTVQRYSHQGWLWSTTSACGVATGDVAARGPAASCPLPGPGSAAWGNHHGTPLAHPATSNICAPAGVAGGLGGVSIAVTSIDGRELIDFAYCAESPCLAVLLCGPTCSISLPASIICLHTCISTGAASTVWGSARALTATAASIDASSRDSHVFTAEGVLLGPPPPVTSYCTPVTVIDAPGGGLHGGSIAVGLAGTFGCFAVARVDGRFAVARLDGLAGGSSAVGRFADGSAVDCLAVARLDGCFAVVHVNGCFAIELLDGLASGFSAVGSFADGSTAVGSATGGDASGVDLSSGVVSAMCGGYACVAVKADGSAVVWGDPARGGEADLSSGVATAMCGWEACVAVKEDNSAVAWGYKSAGGDAAGTSMLPDIITADITSGVIAAAAGEDAKR